MAYRVQSLNPTETLNSNASSIRKSFPLISFRVSSSCQAKPKSRNYPKISVNSNLQQQKPCMDALSSSDRREEVLEIVRSSLSSCLSETNLHLTVPGLKSKSRGKVLEYKRLPKLLVGVQLFTLKSGSTAASANGINSQGTIAALRQTLRGRQQRILQFCLLPLLSIYYSRLWVRDIYDGGDYLVLVTTDRQSAFDRILASIPFKGQVLNETSLWWFNRTRHITQNAVVSAPDKNVTIAKKCSVFPVEFVVRGYVTGSTDTSLWTVYKKGIRNYCGNVLPEGLVKNQMLPANILTPTTKASDHDVPVTPEEIVSRGLMTQADYDEVSRKALSLFEYGQSVAAEHGLILVDTKYEFGKGSDGSVLLLDEVHTPDSSRFWVAQSYEERFRSGLEPENVDKEFLRLWFKENCNPYEDEVLPDAPEELVSELAWRYILLFETITKTKFEMSIVKGSIHDRISRNVSTALSSLK